jgi:beta-glucosidase
MTTKGLRPDFLYGFATAAAQIEGGGADKEKASGKAPSVSAAGLWDAHADDSTDEQIWDAFCDVPGNINDGTHVNKTCDHLGRYKEDVARKWSLTCSVTCDRCRLIWLVRYV